MSQNLRRHRIPAQIWVLGFVSLLMDISSEMVHSLLPVFLVSVIGTSVWVVGLIEGVAEAGALIVKVFSGALSDYFRRRKPLAVLGYGLSAASKPLFALASAAEMVFAARLIDRIGKGIRGAPRDALIADRTPPEIRGASFGLRQALDTVGAFVGPLLAVGLMLLWANDVRAVFWVAAIPGFLAVALLVTGIGEPSRTAASQGTNPIGRENLKRLGAAYWWVVGIGAAFTLARFSEAFLVLRAQQGGLAFAYTPLVLIAMNVVYASFAFPFGKWSDTVSHSRLLAYSLFALIAADGVLAWSNDWKWVWAGTSLWGLHLAMSQGLLASMVAGAAPSELRGTAFGFFNLASGIALLLASAIAGLLWDRLGATFTFVAGGVFGCVALLLIAIYGFILRISGRNTAS